MCVYIYRCVNICVCIYEGGIDIKIKQIISQSHIYIYTCVCVCTRAFLRFLPEGPERMREYLTSGAPLRPGDLGLVRVEGLGFRVEG